MLDKLNQMKGRFTTPRFIIWRSRKTIIGFGIITMIGLTVLSRALFQQLTEIPETLNVPPSINLSTRRQDLQNQALKAVQNMHANARSIDGERVITLNANDLNALFTHQLSLDIETQNPVQIVRATRTEIYEKTLKTTALLDLSQVSSQSFQGNHRLSFLHRLFKIPGIKNQLIAISIEGTPTANQGLLTTPTPTISIGNLSFPGASSSFWLGISEEILQERLNREWHTLPIELSHARIIQSSSHHPHLRYQLQLQGELTAW